MSVFDWNHDILFIAVQVVIFVKSVQRARALNALLNECNFPSVCIYRGLDQQARLDVYKQFKENQVRMLRLSAFLCWQCGQCCAQCCCSCGEPQTCTHVHIFLPAVCTYTASMHACVKGCLHNALHAKQHVLPYGFHADSVCLNVSAGPHPGRY